jgi:hypothetical protein
VEGLKEALHCLTLEEVLHCLTLEEAHHCLNLEEVLVEDLLDRFEQLIKFYLWLYWSNDKMYSLLKDKCYLYNI